jgi:FtsP/CotA-like multicopper oxidase with cupredoxin domain
VPYLTALSLDAAAALVVAVLLGLAATAPAAPRRVTALLLAAIPVIAARAAVDLVMAGPGPVLAVRHLVLDLPLDLVAVGAPLALAARGPVDRRVLWAGAGLATLAALGPVLLTGPVATGALIVAVIAAAAATLEGAGRRRTRTVAGALVAVALVTVAVLGVRAWWQSRVPAGYDLGALAVMDDGGAPLRPAGPREVTTLTGPSQTPDVEVSLTAAPLTVTRNGRRQEAVAFNRTVPGPPIRASVGDLVRVHVCNDGDEDGVSVHWHGYPVPNAEDGVAGVTQDAIGDGACHDYRFRATVAGTYWYHAHQASSTQVDRGLYGALVVSPAATGATGSVGSAGSARDGDLTVLDHAWRPPGGFLDGAAWAARARTETRVVPVGTSVRLRLVNTDRSLHRYRLGGAAPRVLAVDGSDVPGGAPVDGELPLAAGGRYDLGFTMPAGGVRLDGLGEGTAVILTSTPGGPAPARGRAGAGLDLLHYGGGTSPEAESLRGRPDRRFELVMDRTMGFAAGRLGYAWAVDGRTYPRMPMLMVDEGDLVRVRLVNRTTANHPMHLHGHRVLVLSRNGVAATGAPWWSDTLNVAPGEDYEVAFRADNPGIWMDHCHDLQHAADGFVMHLAYTGVTTPFRIGSDTANRPE